jgi:ectoine hydroxylase-related dioxygenase (phytanoyl-CoA dioxygenase family)
MDRTTIRRLYWEHGWVAVEAVFSRDDVAPIRDLAIEIAESELAMTAAPSSTTDVAADGSLRPRKIDWPFLKHQDFRRFALDDRLVSLVEDVLGVRPFLIRDQIFMKPPRGGSPKPFHQDNAHLRCSPADQVIAAWIALDDADEHNGCLQYVDGSHLGALVPHRVVPGAPYSVEPIDRTVLASRAMSFGRIAIGGVLLHHALTFHASARNESSGWRRGYATHWVGPDVTSDTDTLEWAYSWTKGARRVDHLAP